MRPNALRPSPHLSCSLWLLAALIAAVTPSLAATQNPASTVTVDAAANRHPINPNIYGVCYGDAHDMATLNAPLNRWGGNATSRYNWQIDAHSAGADWYFETYSDGSGTPGASADAFIARTRGAGNGAEPLMTIPMIDYLANLGPGRTTLEGFSVKKYGAQKATDPWNADAGNGVLLATGKNITGNDPLDTGVLNSPSIQEAWVRHFVDTFGLSDTTTGIKYYILDNEPSLWNSTHRDVHPAPLSEHDLFDKIVAYATAIRAVDPNAKILGPEEWGWYAMYRSGLDQANGIAGANSDYNTHNQTYYYPWLLQQLAAYKQKTGVQLIDVLTVHGYNTTPDGSDDSLAGQLLRNKETRILWDPNYQDPSWYGDIGINGRVINWIPTLKAMVQQYCPGLQIGFTEYNWGDEANLNGATTQADVLGIYGRDGLDLATRWTVAKDTSKTPTVYYVTYLASQIYRNYDGNGSTFGDTSVSATVANPDNLSAFAAQRSSDGALTVMVINKQQGSTPVTVSLANFSGTGAAQVWQINSATQTSIAQLPDLAVANGQLSTTVPSQSITLFVLPALSISSQPKGHTIALGGTVVFDVAAAGQSPTYQWLHDGQAVAGATARQLTLRNVSAADAGSYTVEVSSGGETITSSPAVLKVVATNNPGRLIAISTRSYVGTGDNVQIGGFVLSGSAPKTVLIRAAGPALATYFGSNVLADPTIDLYDQSTLTVTASNDNWDPSLASVFSSLGEFAFAAGSKDAAMTQTLKPGAYTAMVKGADGGSGIGLVEIYDADPSNSASRLIALSTRSMVGTGDDVQIAGFVIAGATAQTVVLRASGPTLATDFNITGVLPDPVLELHDQSTGAVIATAEGWDSSLTAHFKAVGAYQWKPGTQDTALVMTLDPGVYTAIVKGKSNDTGVAIVEIFDEP